VKSTQESETFEMILNAKITPSSPIPDELPNLAEQILNHGQAIKSSEYFQYSDFDLEL